MEGAEVLKALLTAAGQAAARFNLGLLTRDDYAEVIQELLVRCLPFSRSGQDESAVRAYVFRVARHLQADRIRASAAKLDLPALERSIAATRPAIEDGHDRAANTDLTDAMVSTIQNLLPLVHYQILNERVGRNRTYEQIAAHLKMPVATVQRRYKEAIEIVRLDLMRQAGEHKSVHEALERLRIAAGGKANPEAGGTGGSVPPG